MKEQQIQINKETALKLWKKSFGKQTKVADFAGRLMDKGAYNNRNSKYGWNLDHILPKSKGGKDVESNLICVSIVTNDEKGDSYPCFITNGKKFQIHNEPNTLHSRTIKEVPLHTTKKSANSNELTEETVSTDKIPSVSQEQPLFVCTLTVELYDLKEQELLDSILQSFRDKDICCENIDNKVCITIRNYDVFRKSNMQELFDRSVALNAYLGTYFIKKNIVSKYNISYSVHPLTTNTNA